MTLKRRGFLAMLGAAVTAPMVPAVGAAAPARSAFAVAVAHAQKFPVISAAGLSKHGNMPMAQAEAEIKRLGREGLVKLIGPSRSGAPRAASRILLNDPWGLARTAQGRRVVSQRAKPRQTEAARTQSPKAQSDVPPWLAHVHDLCRAQGMALSPRCFA